jgi:hypothetical protein
MDNSFIPQHHLLVEHSRSQKNLKNSLKFSFDVRFINYY